MKSIIETEEALLNALASWEQLAATDEFAGYKPEQFKVVVEPALEARRQLAHLDREYGRLLLARAQADEIAGAAYLGLVHGIRAHPKHGNNSAFLRALGYVTELERESGLTRVTAGSEPAVPLPSASNPAGTSLAA